MKTTRRGLLLGATASVILGRMPGAAQAWEETSPPPVELLPPTTPAVAMERVTVTVRGWDAFGKSMLETITMDVPRRAAGRTWQEFDVDYGQAMFPGFKSITYVGE